MTEDRFDRDELDEILGALRDDEIDDERMSRLEELVTTSPDARRYYLEYIRITSALHHSLTTDFRGRTSDDAEQAPSVPRTRQNPVRLRLFRVAAILLVTFVAASLVVWQRTGAVHGDGGVAVLSQAVAVTWEGPQATPTIGGSITPGTLRLAEGVAMIDFYSGANVILEGPAEFEVVSTEELVVRRGSASVSLPSQTSAFLVNSRLAKIDGKDATFGVSVGDAGELEVHLFDGVVDWLEPGADRAVTLRPGKGFRDSPVMANTIAADAESFVSSHEVEERVAAASEESFSTWDQFSSGIREDDRVLLSFPFNEVEHVSRVLKNDAISRRRAPDGAIVGCRWVAGRWPEKGALQFKRRSDRVRIEVPGEFRSLTLMAWINVDSLDRTFSSLLLTDGFEPGEVHWQIDDEGTIELSVQNANSDRDYRTPPVFTADDFGRWVHVAAVYDREGLKVIQYVDGEPVASDSIHRPTTLRIGKAEIGNWGVPKTGDNAPIRSFSGRIDEFLIFDAVVGETEIRQIYERGKPH